VQTTPLTNKPKLKIREYNMHPHLSEILFTRSQIETRVKELAQDISRDYEGKNPLVVGILKGSVMFAVDLLKELTIDVEIDFMDVSSYGASISSSGEVRILKDLSTAAQGRDIIIVEDIVDTGNTLLYLKGILSERQATSVKIISLLDKPAGRKVDIEADYVGFEVPDAFIVGYGIDYAEKYRQLPYIGIFNQEFLIK
jgi:hypoxanthine phosphoribosyltransferase